MKQLRRYSLAAICALLLLQPVAAQDNVADTAETITFTRPEDRKISDADWLELSSDSVFRYRNEIETAAPPKESKPPGFWMRLLHQLLQFFLSGIGQLLFWTLILTGLCYVLYRVFKGEMGFIFGRRAEKSPASTTDGETLSEEDLLSADWAEKTRLALQQRELTLATRYTFLQALQLLQQRQQISYRIDKTNYDYYAELSGKDLRDSYRKLLTRYEFAWFGRFPVDEQGWQLTHSFFNELRSQSDRLS